MRIGIIADLHSNLLALQEVVDHLHQRGVKDIFHLGDVVGYGPDPNGVIDFLKKHQIEGVLGNYDESVLKKERVDWSSLSSEKRPGGQVKNWTIDQMEKASLAYLAKLPLTKELETPYGRLLLCHGSPHSNKEYLYEDSPLALKYLKESSAKVVLVGHTHLPMVLQDDGKYLINPGSLGKPKDGTPLAKALILTLSTEQVDIEPLAIAYEVEKVIEQMDRKGLPEEISALLR